LILDLNTDELVAKRKNAERIKEFSRQLRSFNQEQITQQSKLPSATEQNDLQKAKQKYESRRQRAIEFAKQIPKPKSSKEETDLGQDEYSGGNTLFAAGQSRSSYSAGNMNGVGGGGGLVMDEDAIHAAKLQELESKHMQSKAKMEAIKRSLNNY
jgi:hypothetical protein